VLVLGKYFPITTFRLPDCPYHTIPCLLKHITRYPSLFTQTHHDRLTLSFSSQAKPSP
jgi:hypothetical protein